MDNALILFNSKNISQYENPFTAIIFNGKQTLTLTERHATYNWIILLGNLFIIFHAKIETTTKLSFLANLGGILNLTLGISLITICEIIYYFLYKPFRI